MAGSSAAEHWLVELTSATSPISSAALLAMPIVGAPPPKRTIIAQSQMNISEEESKEIISRLCEFSLQKKFIVAAGQSYVVVNISEVAFHARAVKPQAGGLVVVPTQRLVLLAQYNEDIVPVQAVPKAESCVGAMLEIVNSLNRMRSTAQ